MTMGQDKTNFLPGVLRGEGFLCKCKVGLVTKLTRGTGVDVRTSLQITTAEQTPPDGTYDLNISGRIFKVRRQGGIWPSLPL